MSVSLSIFVFIGALYLVIKGSLMATQHAGRLAQGFHLSRYVVGFIIVAVISILPEAFIAVSAAIAGVPSFGLGMLFGSNIADLTLVFAVIIWYAGRSLTVETKILKSQAVYPFLLLLPPLLGLNGHLSRLEGLVLIIVGGAFYYLTLRQSTDARVAPPERGARLRDTAMLVLSLTLLLVGAHFTVASATVIAYALGVSPILVGMLVVGLGTTIPELFFSLQSIRKHDDSLAIGDLLGTVLADATIVVGILALVSPFSFPKRIVYITGTFMVGAAYLLFRFMRSGQKLSRREAYFLFLYWLTFAFVEAYTQILADQ